MYTCIFHRETSQKKPNKYTEKAKNCQTATRRPPYLRLVMLLVALHSVSLLPVWLPPTDSLLLSFSSLHLLSTIGVQGANGDVDAGTKREGQRKRQIGMEQGGKPDGEWQRWEEERKNREMGCFSCYCCFLIKLFSKVCSADSVAMPLAHKHTLQMQAQMDTRIVLALYVNHHGHKMHRA